MKKFVLDTSVLLADSSALYKFDEHQVILPITVIEEIDNRKKDQSEVGRNARQVSRILNTLLDNGDIRDSQVINNSGGTIKVVTSYTGNFANLPLDYSINDNRIINTAFINDATVVSRDTNLRIIAASYGVKSEDYKNDKVIGDEIYTGVTSGLVTTENLNKIYENGKLDVTDVISVDDELFPNICVTLIDECNLKHSALTIYNSTMKEFVLLSQDQKTLGMLPRNAEQCYLLELLKNDDIKLITVSGQAGSGKTLISCLAALDGVMERQAYNRVLFLKPIVPMDNNHQLGFAPGTILEKLAPWMASYSDNIDVIMNKYMTEEPDLSATKKSKKKKESFNVQGEKDGARTTPIMELMAHGLVEFGSLENIRGRSLPNQFILMDEGQNMSINGLRTVLTRVGEGSKIVVMGCVDQIDSPYLDSTNNGLSIIVEKFKSESIAAHITLKKSERSMLAEIAANALK